MDRISTLKRVAFNSLQLNSKPGTPLSFLNWAVIFFIALSLILMGLETEDSVPPQYLHWIDTIQEWILILFAVEFMFRVWAWGYLENFRGFRGRRRLFLRDPLLWADFIAFAPELFVMIFFPGWNAAIGIVRTARFLRLLKLMRFFKAGDMVLSAIANSMQQLLASFFISISVIYFAAYGLYLVEGNVQPDIFGSVMRSMWWSVITLTTVGYGDVHPITPLGKFFAGMIALIGVAMVAMPAGILAGSFLRELREEDARKKRKEHLERHDGR